jgi:hypothetical protein
VDADDFRGAEPDEGAGGTRQYKRPAGQLPTGSRAIFFCVRQAQSSVTCYGVPYYARRPSPTLLPFFLLLGEVSTPATATGEVV